MSDSHKAALAEGREQGRKVRRYLEALEAHKPKRGRKRTVESIQKRLEQIEAMLPSADPLKRLQLVQERIDLQRQLEAQTQETDLKALEADFIAVARAYSERKGISYAAWRELGVPIDTLRAAGINRDSA
jgi:predicted RNase H-like nuclease